MFLRILRRELVVAWRRPADVLNPLFFFIIVVSLFPLGIGPKTETLQLIAPGVLWVAALLATLLSLETPFRGDFEDGSLEQMGVSNQPFLLLVAGKILCHWLVAGLPLVLLSPVLSVMLELQPGVYLAVALSLLVGTPTLSLLGAIGASLVVGLRQGGVLLAILILPLYVPVLILGTSLIQAAQAGLEYQGQLLWLLALLALSAGLGPIAAAAGLKISLSQ